MDGVLKILRRRLLRRFEGVARKECWCYNCTEMIHPGDDYYCEVMAVRMLMRSGETKDEVRSWKQHLDCEPPEPDEDDDDVVEKDDDFPIAA